MSWLWLVSAAVLVGLAGLFSAADAAIATYPRARADVMAVERRAGAASLRRILDDRARYLNTALLVRMFCETTAIVLVAVQAVAYVGGRRWSAIVVSVVVMVVVSFVVIGVSPRTVGRQHADAVALLVAGPLAAITRILGPLPRLLILLGNAITPGKGFREGPFNSEIELRELVDQAEQSSLIEADERRMIHSVFELGDTSTREVMVPRGDIVYVERHKNLRQTMNLFLKSGFSRVPVIGDDLDQIVGVAYLKDIARRDFDAPGAETIEHVEAVMRPAYFVPDSKPADDLLSQMQARRLHIAIVVDEYGGTAGLVTIEDVLEEIVGEITDEYDEAEIEPETLADGVVRVSSRFPVDDLGELIGVHVDDEDVDTVGGLLGKLLGKVPLPGASVEAQGLRFEAEKLIGRRKRIGTVVISNLAVTGDVAEPERTPAGRGVHA